ncbi:MAG: response regulator [Pseudonocardiaceae bacterium]
MIAVLVVDDHDLVRLSLVAVLEGAGGIVVVGECADGSEVLDAAREREPDVIVMDLSMPVMGGLEATRLLLSERPATRVVVLSSAMNGCTVRRAMEAGACGYLLKTADPDELVAAVRAAAAGGRPLSPQAREALRHEC